ncbi:MAG: hypothetical protein ACPG7F_00565 [Aggregatilineales bacterium]
MTPALYSEIECLREQADYYRRLYFTEVCAENAYSDHARYFKQRSEDFEQQVNALLEECEKYRRWAFTGRLRASLKKSADNAPQQFHPDTVAHYASKCRSYFTDSRYSTSVYRRIARNRRVWKNLYTQGI